MEELEGLTLTTTVSPEWEEAEAEAEAEMGTLLLTRESAGTLEDRAQTAQESLTTREALKAKLRAETLRQVRSLLEEEAQEETRAILLPNPAKESLQEQTLS